jgi:hypothetical protein
VSYACNSDEDIAYDSDDADGDSDDYYDGINQ